MSRWVPIQIKGTGRWRIAKVEETWEEGDYTDAPVQGDIFETQAKAEAECKRRNERPTDEDSD
jgi:hypothetical protein